jgi:hypothetical protein
VSGRLRVWTLPFFLQTTDMHRTLEYRYCRMSKGAQSYILKQALL